LGHDRDAGQSSEREIEHIAGPSSPSVTSKLQKQWEKPDDGEEMPVVIPTSDSGEEELVGGETHGELYYLFVPSPLYHRHLPV